jgi:hypothetical protein
MGQAWLRIAHVPPRLSLLSQCLGLARGSYPTDCNPTPGRASLPEVSRLPAWYRTALGFPRNLTISHAPSLAGIPCAPFACREGASHCERYRLLGLTVV